MVTLRSREFYAKKVRRKGNPLPQASRFCPLIWAESLEFLQLPEILESSTTLEGVSLLNAFVSLSLLDRLDPLRKKWRAKRSGDRPPKVFPVFLTSAWAGRSFFPGLAPLLPQSPIHTHTHTPLHLPSTLSQCYHQQFGCSQSWLLLQKNEDRLS